MANTTIKDIARALGLSPATVSRALQDSHEIGEATKKKVRELANQLNYQPNPYASSLRKRKSKTIAVVLPEVADSFFSLAINGIESVAKDKGYHVLIYLTHESVTREEAILSEFKSGRVDGLLISVSEETTSGTHIKKVIDEGMPVVFFDRECDDVPTTKIVTNDFESSYLATTHLINQGCKKIVYLCISPTLSISKNRVNGFNKAIEENKLTHSGVVACDKHFDNNIELVKKLLTGKHRPDGIIASVEKLTPVVYLACKDLGLSIPTAVKLVSFTNLQTSLILNPPLTTITQPAFKMGEKAATILFKHLDKKKAALQNETIVIASELFIRQSSANK